MNLRPTATAFALTRSWLRTRLDTSPISYNQYMQPKVSTEPMLRDMVAFMQACVPENEAAVVAFPARLIRMEIAQGSHATATFKVMCPGSYVFLPCPGVCALQLFGGLSEQVSGDSRKVGLIGGSLLSRSFNPQLGWSEVEVLILEDSAIVRLLELAKLMGNLNHLTEMAHSKEVIHEARNQYGEVVAMTYGPTTVTYSNHPDCWAFLSPRVAFFRDNGFFTPHLMTASIIDQGVAHDPVVLASVASAQRIDALMGKFGGEAIMSRLAERFEEAEVARVRAEEEARQEAFARSLRRRRVISLEPPRE